MPKEFIKDLALALKPPEEGAPSPEYRWRATVAFAIVAGYFLAMVQAAMIWGLAASFGFSGFARAEDMANTKKDFQSQLLAVVTAQRADTNAIMATVISGQILSTYAAQCGATRNNNAELAQSFADQLSGLQVKYMSYTNGVSYPLRPCP